MPERVDEHCAEVDSARVERLTLSAELCAIFARDITETANLSAIDAIKRAFRAAEAALFYVNGAHECRVCLAGSQFPIALAEERWKSIVGTHAGEKAVDRFGPWAMPGIERAQTSWISTRLYASGEAGGFVFLGRSQVAWDEEAIEALASIGRIIAPIVEIRYARDIEERRRKETERQLQVNESRLRDLFEGSRDMIYTADADDVITGVNLAAPALLGLPSKAAIEGQRFSSFVMNPSDRAVFLDKIARDGYVDDYEIVLTKSDGSSIFCLETAHVLRDPAGEVRELQGIIKDITARIEAERDLWRTNLELAEANLKLQKTQILMVQHEKLASIGQLAAGVAHEINNPLGFLMSNTKMLERYFGKLRKLVIETESECGSEAEGRAPSPRVAADLAEIFAEVESVFAESRDGFDRIAKIVASLKNFSRVDHAGAFADYDVNAGIESTLVVAWNEIKYVAAVRKELGVLPLIRANGSEINQIILNIVVNAAQALGGMTRGEKGSIDIRTSADKEAGTVLIAIKDDGPGIPKALQNRIFDPFYTTKDPGKGTGLGLSISYDIVVNKHSGSIWVESEPGQGATFFIVLPIAGPPPEADKPGR